MGDADGTTDRTLTRTRHMALGRGNVSQFGCGMSTTGYWKHASLAANSAASVRFGLRLRLALCCVTFARRCLVSLRTLCGGVIVELVDQLAEVRPAV